MIPVGCWSAAGVRRAETPTKCAPRSTRNNELLNKPDCGSFCGGLFATVARPTRQKSNLQHNEEFDSRRLVNSNDLDALVCKRLLQLATEIRRLAKSTNEEQMLIMSLAW